MKNKIIFFVFIIILIPETVFGFNISGYVFFENNKNYQDPAIGAKVFWENTTIAAMTNQYGYFEIPKTDLTDKLVIFYFGYDNDTIRITDFSKEIKIILSKSFELEEVIVDGDLGGQFNSSVSIEAKQIITETGLNKLPCCNLSESFENNASVDVTFSDALTGAKQIKMLGLDGKYSQILRENMPAIRGLSTPFGLSFIPGTWMHSVQISKGSASVINGYESTTGQINIELKKPENSERLFLNLYGNSEGKIETNLTSAFKISDKLSTMFYWHGSQLNVTHDQNNDGFVDMPLMKQYQLMNRWKFKNDRMTEGQLAFRFLSDEKEGGQTEFLKQKNDNGTFYGIKINTIQYEIFGKLGFGIPVTINSAVGTTFSFIHHEQNSFFGNRNYSGIQNNFNANLIVQTIVKNTAHNLSIGGSFLYDDYKEYFNYEAFLRTEIVPGVFSQYTYILPEKLSFILGARTDFNNIYGIFFIPRVHLKYQLNEHFTLRASAGKGYRTSNVFAENTSVFASSRHFVIEEEFKPEVARNYGINFTGDLHIAKNKEIEFGLDFYRTDFINQIVADINSNIDEIRFYNLKGQSYSNSFQVELTAEPINRLEIFSAFRINDVHVTMNDELIEKPLVSKHRALVTISYATEHKKWMIDITNQFIGTSPLPDLSQNPVEFRLDENSPAYYILHAQITKRFKRIDIYAGAENLSDFKQENLIIDAENPFGDNFDASIIWGPVSGRKFYAGIRLKIN